MKIIHDDIWEFYEKGWHIVIPTNGSVMKTGECVMGRGLAFQAKKLFGKLSFALGKLVNDYGNNVYLFERQKLITFPTKHNWKDSKSDEKLIERSCKQLLTVMQKFPDIKVAIPKVGCGAGKKEWDMIAPMIYEYFGGYSDKKFCVVDNEQGDANQDFRGKNKEKIRGLDAKLEDQIIDIRSDKT